VDELSAARTILDTAIRKAQQANAKRIAGVHVAMGRLKYLAEPGIQMHWENITNDSIAKGVKIDFRRIPAALQCMICAEKYSPPGPEFSCPNCGSVGAKVLSGDEFVVESVEVEK